MGCVGYSTFIIYVRLWLTPKHSASLIFERQRLENYVDFLTMNKKNAIITKTQNLKFKALSFSLLNPYSQKLQCTLCTVFQSEAVTYSTVVCSLFHSRSLYTSLYSTFLSCSSISFNFSFHLSLKLLLVTDFFRALFIAHTSFFPYHASDHMSKTHLTHFSYAF